MLNLGAVAQEILRRVVGIFLPDSDGHRPHQGTGRWPDADPASREWLLFHEYFHAETGRGLGASHQTGWTALVATCLEKLARRRSAPGT